MKTTPTVLAVIDVGTLKVKFEVREYTDQTTMNVLFKDKKLTVLGRDLTKNDGVLLEPAIQTTIEAILEFKQKMHDLKVSNFKAVTTAAIRVAKNGQDALEKIHTATGIQLDVLTHEQEAHIFFEHVSKMIPDKTVAVADIGGGSVQVAIGKNGIVDYTHLFKTGSYFMQETFYKTHFPTQEELRIARDYVAQEFRQLRQQPYRIDEIVYGSTNIIDYLQVVNLNLEPSGYAEPHPFRAQIADLEALFEKITQLSYEDRMPLYPAEPYYMWSTDNSLMNIFELAEIFTIESIIPTNENISAGIFSQLLQQTLHNTSNAQ